MSSSALLLLVLLTLSAAPSLLACGSCGGGNPVTPSPRTRIPILPPIIGGPPINLPPVITPVVPKIPPVTIPPVILPPVTGGSPPVTGGSPPVTGGSPPVTGGSPPVTRGSPPVTGTPCPTPSPTAKNRTCPVNTLKFRACADLLGGVVSVISGSRVARQCCPLVKGLADVEAAACLCTVIKLKVLNINVVQQVILELLVTCGKNAPAGYTCPV